MPEKRNKNRIDKKILLTNSLIVFLFLVVISIVFVFFLRYLYPPSVNQPPQVTVIGYKTPTIESQEKNGLIITVTQNIPPQKYSKGLKVKIQGTGGEGLRIHQDAGQGSPTIYLAQDGEIFIVNEGPVVSGGYVWWKIESTTPEKIIGWAVEDYFAIVINSPE